MTDRPEAIRIAYYSMEVALDDAVPTFSGGLGVLAGDHLRAAADRAMPVAGVSLLYRHGFFRQTLSEVGQHEARVEWAPSTRLDELPLRLSVDIGGRPVALGVWLAQLTGVGGHRVPVYFLDTDVAPNTPQDRAIADRLYASDPAVRLRQEAVLGIGGPLALEALGHRGVAVHHLNEGHGSLVGAALLARRRSPADPAGALARGLPGASGEDVEAVRARCVFTTHTPVPAGHDRFDPETAATVLGGPLLGALERLGCLETDGTLNMTVLGTRCAGSVNGVSMRHAEVTRAMLATERVSAITNGVHTATWAAPATAGLLDAEVPGWRHDAARLRSASALPIGALRAVHRANKGALCDAVRRLTGVELRTDVLTLGVARRFARYKRNDLILSDLERLGALADEVPLQIVFAGKAHPDDADAKAMVRRVASVASVAAGPGGSGSGGSGSGGLTVAFVEDYGMELGRTLCAGSDIWLNTPIPPNEASGTSGMKAALNGVPSLSTLDGWWLEGCVEGVTGWAIPDGCRDGDADPLYRTLEETVIPAYAKDPEALTVMGRHALSLNASYFSAHRMVDEYASRAYRAAGVR